MKFTNTEKLAEIERELLLRHRVYRRMVVNGKLTNFVAARQIAILTAVASDYRERAKDGPLFELQG